MWKKRQHYTVKSKKRIKRYMKVSLLLLALLLGSQQTNMIGVFSSIHANAKENLLAIGTDYIYEGDEAVLIVSRSSEDAETIEFTMPDGIAIDIDRTEENFSDTTEFTFNEDNNSVKVSYTEGTSEQSVELYISCEEAGSYRISATSTVGDSSVLDLTVHETTTEEQATSDEQIKVEEAVDTSQVEERITEETEGDASQVDSQTRATTYAEENEVAVSNWAEFQAAYNDASVTKISLLNDIESPSSISLKERRTSIEIEGSDGNGGYYTLGLRSRQSLLVNTPTNTGETPLFHVHDLHLGAVGTNWPAYGMDVEGSWAFIEGYSAELYQRTNKWKFRFGNITNDPQVARIARAYRAEVTLYGNLDLDTKAENFYVGSMIIEDGTHYKGNVNYYNYSVIWFVHNSTTPAGNTGASREFTIGKNAVVQLTQSQSQGTDYPAVYWYWDTFTVGENSKLDINMPGKAIAFSMNNSEVIIKEGAYVNLTSQRTNSVIAYRSIVNTPSNCSFIVEPGAELYVIGTNNTTGASTASMGSGLIDMNGTGHSFILNSPKSYDIRNKGTSPAINLGTNSTVSITDSDIDLWKMKSDLSGTADLTNPKVAEFTVTGNKSGSSQKVSSSDDNLQTTFGNTQNYRRITGLNGPPTVEFDEAVTDADYTIKARVKIGEVPTDEGLVNGVVNYEPVYAAANQAAVDITDTFGVTHEGLTTDANGYAKYTDDVFQIADKDITATATRGPWIQETPSTTTVLDVTPPEIANVFLEYIDTVTQVISGTADEIGATVIVEVDGVALKDSEGNLSKATVDEDGNWSITLSNTLEAGQTVQILLNDNTGALSSELLTDIPSTNNAIGNQNPTTERQYHDAIFEAGPLFTVIEYQGTLTLVAPDSISFGDNVEISPQDTFYPIETADNALEVIDTRIDKSTWTLTAELVDELHNEIYDSTLSLIYVKGENESILSTDAKVPIYEHTNTENEPFSILDTWYGDSEDGLYVEAKAGQARVGEYAGTIKWTLEDTPANEE